MGILNGLSRFFVGKPVFDNDTGDSNSEGEQKKAHLGYKNEHGQKIIPEVAFKNFKTHRNGNKVTTWAWATNVSQFELELEKLELLGKHYHIDRRLRPNEGHEVKIYDGPVITHEHDTRAKLYFTIHENDDLFLADYYIEFNRESDGSFILEDFHRDHTPRDI